MRSNTVLVISSRRLAVAALAGGLALTLSACADDDSTVRPAGGASSATSGLGAESDANQADVAFIEGMIPHHDGALAMADMAVDRAESPQVQDLAKRIAAAQGPEIEQMQNMAAAWGVELTGSGRHGGMGGMAGMDGMPGMGDDVAALGPHSGAAFDRAFLSAMIVHHQGAVEMADVEITRGEADEAIALAERIREAQTAEIAEMEQLLRELP